MVGRTKELTTADVAKMLGLLTEYQDNLIYKASEGARLNEDEHTAGLREIAMENVSKCIKTVSEDLQTRVSKYY